MYLFGQTQLVLHMMTNLMGDHIGLGKLARRFELAGQLLKEAQVQINLLIDGAIERADRRVGKAAGGGDLATEQHQLGLAILFAELFELLRPNVLGIGQDHFDELGLLVVDRRCLLFAWGSGARLRTLLLQVDEFLGVDAEDQCQHDDDQ